MKALGDPSDKIYEVKVPNAMVYGCPWYYKSTSEARRVIDQGKIVLGVDGFFSQIVPGEYSFISEVLNWISFTFDRKDGGTVLSSIDFKAD